MKPNNRQWKKSLRKHKLHIGYGWAWSFEGGTCHWAAPNKEELLRERKPSPEAKPIKVALVPIQDWYRARKAREDK